MTTREHVNAWLEQAFSDGLPDGLDEQAEASVDKYAMWSALTALTQEVRLQGRAFKQLSDGLDTQSAERGRAQSNAREGEHRARRETVDLLLDLRERLQRGLRCLEQPVRWSWWQRLAGHPRVWRRVHEALSEGYRLNLAQLEHKLEVFDVREIACQDGPFDPHTMTAVEVRNRAELPDGTVLEILRPGYLWAGELRPTAAPGGRAGPSGL